MTSTREADTYTGRHSVRELPVKLASFYQSAQDAARTCASRTATDKDRRTALAARNQAHDAWVDSCRPRRELPA